MSAQNVIRFAVLLGAVLRVSASASWAQGAGPRTVHVFVALADNQSQGIIPVPAKLGNGEDPEHNLYWGSAYGVKTFFARSEDWSRIKCGEKPKVGILERCVFKHRASNVYLVADAYQGREIRQAILDFLASAAGDDPETICLAGVTGMLNLMIRGSANLVAYIGHDALMDFQLPRFPRQKNDRHRDAVVLACASNNILPRRCEPPVPIPSCGPPG